jgi:hypothetical protein
MKCFVWILYLLAINMNAQVDADLLKIRQRMDAIEQFTADLKLDVDIDFINMPTKSAGMTYVKGKPIKFSSDDFVMIPKRGLDFTMNMLFAYPFITVDRGTETRSGKSYKVINVIPTDKRADFSIATLLLDTGNMRIAESEINTKKDGTYTIVMKYETEKMVLPNLVEVNFEIERIKIPLNFAGKDATVDKKKMNAQGTKTGKIILRISNYRINRK